MVKHGKTNQRKECFIYFSGHAHTLTSEYHSDQKLIAQLCIRDVA